MNPYRVAGIVVMAGLRAQAADCSVNVYVLAGAPLPGGMLLEVISRTTAMFRNIGVDMKIRNGIPASNRGGVCGAPIVVRIEVAERYSVRKNALAYAQPYKDSGTCIHVFVDRVMKTAIRMPGLENALLAHVVAHEIAHVLERIVRHSEQGVMKASWSDRDYVRMKRDPLPFAPEDVKLIRDGLAWRAAHAAAE